MSDSSEQNDAQRRDPERAALSSELEQIQARVKAIYDRAIEESPREVRSRRTPLSLFGLRIG